MRRELVYVAAVLSTAYGMNFRRHVRVRNEHVVVVSTEMTIGDIIIRSFLSAITFRLAVRAIRRTAFVVIT